MIIVQGYANGVNVVLVLLYYANNLCEEDILKWENYTYCIWTITEKDLKHIPLKHLHYFVTKQVFIHSGPCLYSIVCYIRNHQCNCLNTSFLFYCCVSSSSPLRHFIWGTHALKLVLENFISSKTLTRKVCDI